MSMAFALLASPALLAATAPALSPAAALVDMTTRVCTGFANGGPAVPAAIGTDARLFAGISASARARLGSTGAAFVGQTATGEVAAGDDLLLFAPGRPGAGCRAILVGETDDDAVRETAALLAAKGWAETGTVNRAGAVIRKRMFVGEDADGQAYTITLSFGRLPGSQFRAMTTLALLPMPPRQPESF